MLNTFLDMSNLLCTVYCQNSICIMGCHGNGYILYSLNEFLFWWAEDIVFSHLVGPSEQIDTHDKLSLGCNIG